MLFRSIDVVSSTLTSVISRSDAPANDDKKSSVSSAGGSDGGLGSRLSGLLGGKKKSD